MEWKLNFFLVVIFSILSWTEIIYINNLEEFVYPLLVTEWSHLED